VTEISGKHQFSGVLASLEVALRSAADLNPAFLSPSQVGETLLALQRVSAQIAELVLRVMGSAPAQALAEESGARDVAAWLAASAPVEARAAHGQLRLAQALERREATRVAMAQGLVSVEQARVIVQALDALAVDPAVDPEVLSRAEAHLVELAATHGPRELRRLAAHLLEVVAPEVADAADARALARLEERAQRRQSLSITPAGDGLTRIHGLVPEAVGERLRLAVEAYAQPRVAALEADGKRLPRSRVLAEAFGQLLETIDPDRVPAQGGDATTVIVTIDHDKLTRDLATAELGGGVPITAAEARRLACTAKILPAVLDGQSQPLDLGRAQRLFTPAQRKALRLRDKRCRAEGCTAPAEWCDAHHLQPWAEGGSTDLANGVLFCGHHHRRAHDPTYTHERLPNGDYRFHRRT